MWVNVNYLGKIANFLSLLHFHYFFTAKRSVKIGIINTLRFSESGFTQEAVHANQAEFLFTGGQ